MRLLERTEQGPKFKPSAFNLWSSLLSPQPLSAEMLYKLGGMTQAFNRLHLSVVITGIPKLHSKKLILLILLFKKLSLVG